MLTADGGQTMIANVNGRGGRIYATLVRTGVAGGEWVSRCSCPMVCDCKHVAAVLLHARALVTAAVPVSSPWQDLLGPLLDEPTCDCAPLALQVEIHRPQPHRWNSSLPIPPTVRLRPMIPGKRGGWIKTGASWNDISQTRPRVALNAEHQSVLREMYAVALHVSPSYLVATDGMLRLDHVGPGGWRLLRQAVDAGVSLLPADRRHRSVELASTTAEVTLQARLDDGDAVLEPVVCLGGQPLEDDEIVWIGSPATGFAFVGAGEGAMELHLVQLQPALDSATAKLVRNGPVRVPRAEVPRFVTGYLPRLGQRMRVTSVDDALAPATVEGPFVGVRVQAGPDHRTQIQIGWVYEVDGTGFQVPIDRPTPREAPARDHRAEAELASALTYLDAVSGLRVRTATGYRLPSTVTLTGLDTIRFFDRVLPELIVDERVRVNVQGDLPDYRQIEEAPLITVSATDSDDPGRTDWFDLGIEVSVGGEVVPFTPLFTALASGQDHLVLDSGSWFTLDRPELQQLRRLIEEARALQEPGSSGLQLTRLHAGLWEELVELGVVANQSARWQASVAALLTIDEIPAPPAPSGLQATLRGYQERGYQWLSLLWNNGLGGVLADDMGLGKTVQVLALASAAHHRGELAQPLLIVCPTSVIGTWAEQAARFVPQLRVATVTETRARRGLDLATIAADADLVVTSYTLLRLEERDYHALQWSGMVLDEAQAVKNYRAKTYQSVRRVPAPFRLAVTGTPLENSLMDLWSLLSIVAPGLYPDPVQFTDEYRRPIESGADPEQLTRLRRRIRPLMLRRTKHEVAPELPPKQEQVLHVDLAPAHRRVYSKHLQRERQRVLGMLDDVQKNRIAIFRALTMLRQLSLAPSLVDDDYAAIEASKIDVLMGQVREVVAEGHRALVFSQFTGFLKLVRTRLEAAGIGYSYLDGRTRDRAARIAAFREGDDPLFLISLKAGGFGLTLTEADYVFILDPWWNPAAEEQAIDRTHRIGQDKTVMVYRLVATDTIEEKVVALQDRKRRLFADVVGAEGLLGAPLTPDDIRGLFEP